MPKLDLSFGPESRNRLADATTPTHDGALAALETFYHALNGRHPDVLAAVWSSDPLAQLNNPLGGILRGGREIAALYDRILQSPAKVTVRFEDIVEYAGEEHAVFAGREQGTFVAPDGTQLPLNIRTTRYFVYHSGRWAQLHHHGSIDDPWILRTYQQAVTDR